MNKSTGVHYGFPRNNNGSGGQEERRNSILRDARAGHMSPDINHVIFALEPLSVESWSKAHSFPLPPNFKLVSSKCR